MQLLVRMLADVQSIMHETGLTISHVIYQGPYSSCEEPDHKASRDERAAAAHRGGAANVGRAARHRSVPSAAAPPGHRQSWHCRQGGPWPGPPLPGAAGAARAAGGLGYVLAYVTSGLLRGLLSGFASYSSDRAAAKRSGSYLLYKHVSVQG